jgi:hypothetical protein
MKTKDWISIIMFRILELSFVAAFLAVLVLVLKKEVPAGNKDLINIMLGILATSVTGIAGYEWGSSRGSDRKTEIMAGPDPTTKQTTETTTTETPPPDIKPIRP